jgi:signal transduction histidine kinase
MLRTPLPPQPVKFLLVDDAEDNLLVLEALLARPDLVTLKARSGPEALELLLVHEVALALIDVQMPEMDGFELAGLMRGVERTRHVPIIFVTASSRRDDWVFQGYDAGAVDFLTKPVDSKILRHKAETFYQLHTQRQQLARKTLELEETLRFHETFVAAVGHDLRNPLNAMLIASQILSERLEQPDLLRVVARLSASGERMARMLEDLSDLARLRLGQGIELECKPLDLENLVRRLVSEQGVTSAGRTIQLELKGDCMGVWDGGSLERVVSNLLGNAVTHGSASAPVEVLIDGRSEERVLLSFKNGGAIPAPILPTIFDPFKGRRTGAGGTNGLGLGLYIVKKLSEAHGGDVRVHSSEENGTTFVVTLPRRA